MVDRKDVVHALAAMTDDEYQATVREARGPDDPQVMKQLAVDALRRKVAGHNVTQTTKKSAAEAKAELDRIFGKDR